jgi:hypothetical protein
MICGTAHQFPTDLPDAGEGACCIGAAVLGPDRCTCWEPVYDLDQQPPRTELRDDVRDSMCADCAYRPDSPERTGDPQAAGDWESLQVLAAGGNPFWCHAGMRRPVAFRHPSGVEIGGSDLDYAPPIVNGVPYRADGTPGDVCAGWEAMHRGLEARRAKDHR